MNILIIEDEIQLSEILATLLKQHDYSVDTANDGITGEEYALTGIYDAIILDIMLPRKNGLEVLETLRKEKLSTPILLLTAKTEIEDKISGLDLGADDYLTKPFETGELLARIRAMTRRQGTFVGEELNYNETSVDKRTHKLSYKGNTVQLSGKEFQIVEILMQNSSQVISRELLIEKVWGFDSDAEYNAIEVYISFVRRKLDAVCSPMQIKAVRGVGYILEESE